MALYGVIKNNNNNSNYAHQAVSQGCGSDLAGGRLEARAGRPNGRAYDHSHTCKISVTDYGTSTR